MPKTYTTHWRTGNNGIAQYIYFDKETKPIVLVVLIWISPRCDWPQQEPKRLKSKTLLQEWFRRGRITHCYFPSVDFTCLNEGTLRSRKRSLSRYKPLAQFSFYGRLGSSCSPIAAIKPASGERREKQIGLFVPPSSSQHLFIGVMTDFLMLQMRMCTLVDLEEGCRGPNNLLNPRQTHRMNKKDVTLCGKENAIYSSWHTQRLVLFTGPLLSPSSKGFPAAWCRPVLLMCVGCMSKGVGGGALHGPRKSRYNAVCQEVWGWTDGCEESVLHENLKVEQGERRRECKEEVRKRISDEGEQGN